MLSHEPARCWKRALSPHFLLSQLLCGGRKVGGQAAGQLWGVKDLSSVKQGKCSVVLLFLLHSGYGLGHAQKIMAIFAAAERGCVIAWLGDAQYYLCAFQPCKDALCKTYGSRCWRDKVTHLNVLGIIRWARGTPFLICTVVLIRCVIKNSEDLLSHPLAKQLLAPSLEWELQSIIEVPRVMKISSTGYSTSDFLFPLRERKMDQRRVRYSFYREETKIK